MESKTEGAKQASDTFEKKADATKRAQDIADNRGTKVIEHNKMKHQLVVANLYVWTHCSI